MDPQTDLPDLVEDLEVNIDELTDTLAPLLGTPLSTTATSLPLLDKAKLYVLAAYAVESLLFSTLQASGVDAKSHAVFTELARLRTYFAKIKDVEERLPGGPWENRARVDKEAAARFIKHGLSGNDRYDKERAERMAREKARALEKAKTVNKKFDDDEEEEAQEATPRKRGAEDEDEDDAETTPAAKKLRSGKGRSKKDVESTPDTDAPTPARSTRSATALQDGAAASPVPVPATKTKTKTKTKGKAKGKAKAK